MFISLIGSQMLTIIIKTLKIMKTIRLFGVALLTVLLSVGFSSCSKSDDDNGDGGGGGTSASIEGKWYLKSEVWYEWKDGQPDMANMISNDTYGDYANKKIWTIQKSGDDLIITETTSHGDYKIKPIKNGNNDYKYDNHRFVIKSVSSNSLVVDYYHHYYEKVDTDKDFGVYTFMR
jgi:hypothetical protein